MPPPPIKALSSPERCQGGFPTASTMRAPNLAIPCSSTSLSGGGSTLPTPKPFSCWTTQLPIDRIDSRYRRQRRSRSVATGIRKDSMMLDDVARARRCEPYIQRASQVRDVLIRRSLRQACAARGGSTSLVQDGALLYLPFGAAFPRFAIGRKLRHEWRPAATGFSREGFLVSARTRLQHARRPCRRQARSGDRRAGNADLPDHLLRVRRCRSRRLAVRPEGVRQHLHPHHEPDAGGAGRAAGRARRRHGGPRHGVRPRRAVAGVPHHPQPGRQFRRGAPALWRLDQPVRPCLQEFRLGSALGRPA